MGGSNVVPRDGELLICDGELLTSIGRPWHVWRSPRARVDYRTSPMVTSRTRTFWWTATLMCA